MKNKLLPGIKPPTRDLLKKGLPLLSINILTRELVGLLVDLN